MSIIICNKKDCMYIKKVQDGTVRCNCTAISIKQDLTCDSYYVLPEEVNKKLKNNELHTSVLVSVLDTGNPNNKPCVIMGYIGGYNKNKDWNVWWEEIDNSFFIEDIFINCNNQKFPDEPGFYVWEGIAEPQYEDAPYLKGEWRKATLQDFLKFQKE